MSNGSTLKEDNADVTQAVTGITVGQIRGLNELIDLTHEKVEQLLNCRPDREPYGE